MFRTSEHVGIVGTTIVAIERLPHAGGAVCDFQSRAESTAFQAVVVQPCRDHGKPEGLHYFCRAASRAFSGLHVARRVGDSGWGWKCSETSREAEPKVVVAEGRIELAAQRDAAHRVRVAPRAAARGASHALVGARGIPLR